MRRNVVSPVVSTVAAPFDPVGVWRPSVTSGLVLLWEPAASQVTKDSSGLVSVQNDTSGAGNHSLTQTGSSRPLWVENGIAGRAALEFNGASTYLESPTIVLPQPHTVVAVYSRIGAQGTAFIYDSKTLSPDGRTALLTGGATTTLHYYETTAHGAQQISVTHTVSTSGELVIASYNTTSSFVEFNGSRTNTVSTATDPTITQGFTAGARATSHALVLSGRIAVMAVWNRALSAGETTATRTDFRARWPVY
jgi:hypothetical protein